MKKNTHDSKWGKAALFAIALPLSLGTVPTLGMTNVPTVYEEVQAGNRISEVRSINLTTVEVKFADDTRMTLDFYGENIFRLFQDKAGGIIRDPEAKPEAQILVSNPRLPVSTPVITDDGEMISIATDKIKIQLDKETSLMKVTNLETQAVVLEETKPVDFGKKKVTVTLKENPDEYFYGGGVQNGRFSHKGKAISIENQNSWTDGGVASPTPFYWSTNGYGIMWYTFKKGKYDFGADEAGSVKLSHETQYLDLFCMVDSTPVALLNDFYQLTGHPVLLPKFGFYQGHLNAYNRDYWTEDENGILFEDGKRYKESQKDNGGIKESVNGEKDNYQFSARAVIDRYQSHDMPLGWLLPNDGYGSGYGQTETLDGNIQNLKELGDYARNHGVEIGLWTQSDLHPKPEVSALLQRDIVKEVRDAGVRVLKTDVAWVGDGYSFGLNGVADVGHIMPYYGNNARPFIISLDGWAGTQRYAGIWTGDQTGGEWEYIRFHIPTYIGTGLSGQPNITSDMDGIFGGENAIVNTRDFQWKTWTPMELNMDGWGSNEKYPHAMGEPATSINRMYLKLKSALLPYAYSFAKEAVDGLPLIRAMFLECPNTYTWGKATQYQYMYGSEFLVAPVYRNTKADAEGNDIRNGIYLPEGEWIDYFSGTIYTGGCVINNFDAPLWKLPVFVKRGAIIPMTTPNNHVSEIDKALRIYEVYPYGHSSFTEYDDDGVTEAYRDGKGVTTFIESEVTAKGDAVITVHSTQGDFDGFVKEKVTEFRINVSEKPKSLAAKIGNSKVKLTEVASMDEFQNGENVYYYDAAPNLNLFATPGSEFSKTVITKNPQVCIRLSKTDITTQAVTVTVGGFRYESVDSYHQTSGTLTAPKAQVTDDNAEAYSLKATWEKVPNADFYEIEYNGMIYSTIRDTEMEFDELKVETTYTFKIRAVNKDGHSEWSEFTGTTKIDPLEYAIRGIKGETNAPRDEECDIKYMFNFTELGEMWFTEYEKNAVPFDIIIDLRSINQLDKFHYLCRRNYGNGTMLKGTVYYSMNKEEWTEAGTFDWNRKDPVKVFTFTDHPTARYIKLAVTETVGNYGSGREIYVFKVPGTATYLCGDINNDGKIDNNDLTSYMNYTGLRKGDGDFEGYISNGDINLNGLIDAYDISMVTTQLSGGIDEDEASSEIGGHLEISTEKSTYDKDETIEITVKGVDLKAVNALSFALPYDQQKYEFIGMQPIHLEEMENLTYDRLHSNGDKVLYPTFVNIGDKSVLEDSDDLFILKFKAKQKVTFDLQMNSGLLVNQRMNSVKL